MPTSEGPRGVSRGGRLCQGAGKEDSLVGRADKKPESGDKAEGEVWELRPEVPPVGLAA